MSFNRVQKLLFSEYCDFEDMVLIESPFAQTTRDGRGIRQVHLGLTPSKLVLATDVLPPAEYCDVRYDPDVDPDIETFELIAIYPVECVNLSVYRKRRKQALKARFCNNKVLYFELGGFERRAMFWNLWCERVKFLCPGHSSSSKSETSVATSSTGSTMYLVDKRFVRINSKSQVWCRFGASTLIGGENGAAHEKLVGKWTDKHLYLGKSFEGVFNFQPKLDGITGDDFVAPKTSAKGRESKQEMSTNMEEEGLNFGDIVKVNRFGLGISEGCGNPLYLSVDDYLIPKRYSTLMKEMKAIHPDEDPSRNIYQLIETAVLEWELYNADDPNKYKIRHRRRYGLATCPLMAYGLNPLVPLDSPKCLLQMKRAVSEVSIRKSRNETELTLPVDKRILRSSLSLQCLTSYGETQPSDIFRAPKRPSEFFWTTNYRYQPKSSKESYEELRKQMRKLKQLHSGKAKRKRKKRSKRIFKKNIANQTKCKDSEDDSADEFLRKKIRKKKHGFIYTMFRGIVPESDAGSTLDCLKMALHEEINPTAWDLDSTKLAEQLTMIDRDLFLKIPTSELEVIVQQKSSENAPNVCTLLAFSHRISCLLATEVLKNDTEKTRARLIARFINAANKCHRVSNFQSCKTIISSLQSPGVYRLRNTWAYLRKKHASKYQCFEILCRLYRDCRLPTYQKTFYLLSQNPPFLPHISDVISRLLGQVPGYVVQPFTISRLPSVETTKSVSTIVSMEDPSKPISIIAKIIRVFKGGGGDTLPGRREIRKRSRTKQPQDRRSGKYKTLCEYYADVRYDLCDRFEDLAEAKKFLEKCQLGAMDYNFRVDESARGYLLRARYGEDKKNFYKSLSLEPPRAYYRSKSEEK